MKPTDTITKNQTPATPQCGLIPPRNRRVKSETPQNVEVSCRNDLLGLDGCNAFPVTPVKLSNFSAERPPRHDQPTYGLSSKTSK